MLWETGRLSFNERKDIAAAFGIFVNSQICSFGTTIFIISCRSIAHFSVIFLLINTRRLVRSWET